MTIVIFACVKYPNLPSEIRPNPREQDVPFPKLPEFTEVVTMSSSSDDDIGLDVYKPDSAREPQLLGQGDLNNLVRDLGLYCKLFQTPALFQVQILATGRWM